MKPTEVQRIVQGYGAVLGENTATGVVRDISSLPDSKLQIKAALLFALKVTTEKVMREHLKSAYISLADFQVLSDEQVKVLQEWNKAMASKVDLSANLASTISELGKRIFPIQETVAQESVALTKELRAAGF